MKKTYFRHTFICSECHNYNYRVTSNPNPNVHYPFIDCGSCHKTIPMRMHHATDLCVSLLDADVLQEDAYRWSQKTFGINRGAVGPLNHLIKEVNEAIDNPNDIMEFADMWLLLSDAASSSGFTMSQILGAASIKLAINKNRKWGPTDANGVSEHIKE